MEQLRCVVERITYRNNENGYSVIKCRAKGYAGLVAATGIMSDVCVGSVLTLGGVWRMDARHGRQFCFQKYEETLPATAAGIEKYLGSGLVRGIGSRLAHRIMSHFGGRTLEIIEHEPDSLAQVPGIGKKLVESVKTSWAGQKEIRNIMLFLQSHDVSAAHAAKIFRAYGAQSIETVKSNPYRLADDIWGIGFKTADTIAKKLGFDHERYERLRSGIIYTLNRLSELGHCFALREELLDAAEKLLDAGRGLLGPALERMIEDRDVILDKTGRPAKNKEEAVYLPPFYFAEKGTAAKLLRLLRSPGSLRLEQDALSKLKISGMRAGIRYDDAQLEAIVKAASSRVFVLTGGPGTGKTTTTLGIITAFRAAGAKVLLAAPTGRAAKRLSEAAGMEAKTIHRLLEMRPPEGYQRNEKNPLEGDALIIDECSMVDIMLMYSLLKALPEHMTLILVGDADQLPSVGPGKVLSDILASGVVPGVRLEKIFRQARHSRIVTNAHRINSGGFPDIRGGRDSDFFFIERKTPEEAADLIVQYCKKNLPDYYHVSPLDVQVLTPMQRGEAGAANLNRRLQQALNPSGACIHRGGIDYRLRDKVMQIRNDYNKEVFNGDIGFISRVNPEGRELTVSFDGRSVPYDISELDELVPAYATTIHKAQGSEYPVVVIPVMMSHYVMLQRNLLYTGVTRARRALVLVGEKRAVYFAVKNDKSTGRNTRLAERLAALSDA